MSRLRTDDGTADGVLAEAAAWRVRLAEAGMEGSEAFEAWLAADSAHRSAWERVNGPWELIGEQATAPELMAMRRDALDRARRRGSRRWAGVSRPVRGLAAAAAVLVAIAAGIGAWTWQAQRPDIYRTALGERRVIPLQDGSRVSLDSRSQVRVRYTGDARRLELRAGQARFDVAPDARRPFSVRAGGRLVIATGTAFNVDLFGDRVLVTLIEGRVEIREADARADPGRAGPQGRELAPGDQLVAAPQSEAVVARVDLARATAWESGQLVFTDEPLLAVAERVGRYSGRPVQVDPAAAQLRVSGVFKAGDVDTFVDTVTRYLPVTATVREDAVVLRRD